MSSAPTLFDYEQTEAFNALVEGEGRVFESRTRLLVFAAAVGYHRNERVADHDENGEMRWNYISQNPRLSVIVSSLAYADTEDPSIILDPQRQIETLTAFGAGGSRILEREVVDEPGKNLDNLLDFIQEHRDEDRLKEQAGILEEIEQEISSFRSA